MNETEDGLLPGASYQPNSRTHPTPATAAHSTPLYPCPRPTCKRDVAGILKERLKKRSPFSPLPKTPHSLTMLRSSKPSSTRFTLKTLLCIVFCFLFLKRIIQK